jgi:ubiquinone/menaquinone biosynthesis C-methylase UbiE
MSATPTIGRPVAAPPTDPARTYEAYYGPAIFEPLSDHTITLAAPGPGERVLDLACGTGIVARRLVRAVAPAGHVVALDRNPAMLAVGREALAAADGAGATVEWREGDAVHATYPTELDLVVCQQGLQFFDDRVAAARRIVAALRPGGRAVVACWRGLDVHEPYRRFAELERPHLEAFGITVPWEDLVAPFLLGDADELRSLFAEAGAADVQVHRRSIVARFPEPDRFLERMEHAYAAVIPRFADDPDAFARYLAAIDDDARPLVDELRDGDHVVVPMHTNVAVITT